jgi:hypothetical protein
MTECAAVLTLLYTVLDSPEMTLPPTLWPMEKTRCPYCVENGNFKPMTKGEGGERYKCDSCGHIVMPYNKLFECPCLKCFELNPESLKRKRRPKP